jgi:hypothetical protein
MEFLDRTLEDQGDAGFLGRDIDQQVFAHGSCFCFLGAAAGMPGKAKGKARAVSGKAADTRIMG